MIFAACEIGAPEWNKSGLYTGGTAEDWEDLEAVAPEAVTAWKEAGQPLNRTECARIYGEELTKEAKDAHTVARHRAKYSEEWRDELREIWAIYKDLTATDRTTDSTAAQTGADATLCEAGEITDTTTTDTAEDFDRLTQAGEQPEDCGKVWQFERCTDANGHELHEIRRVPSGFMVFFNVCEATGGGCSTMAVYPTYCEALEVLTHCRSGAQLIAQPAA